MIEDLTIKDAKIKLKEYGELQELFNIKKNNDKEEIEKFHHPMLGKKCIIRTYSAGVHFGLVDWINPTNSMEIKLKDSFRLWKWENGGLSLSAIATNGMQGGRIDKTGEIYLTNVIEYIPYSKKFEDTYNEYIED